MRRELIIAGGGLAGLTLGILLRREGLPVRLFEAADYPRHRVCGEFLSGKGRRLLESLGLSGNFQSREASSVQFLNGGRASATQSLPQPALCVSRFDLDHALAKEFVREGGHLHCRQRWCGSFLQEGVVRATGRRLAQNGERGQWLGLKVHLQRLDLAADLEMHFGPFGYAGLARLHGGAVNLCGLFRRDASCEGLEGKLRNIRADPRAFLARVVSAEAAARLNSAEVDNESFASVSGFEFTAGAAKDCGECRIGDSISMIPPVTGNGMSLAVESAFVAAPVLSCYAAGKLDWAETRRQVSQLCEREFRSRLLFSSFLQKLLFLRAGRFLLLSSIRTVPGVMRLFFAATR